MSCASIRHRRSRTGCPFISRRGFSLIELLVVILIIGILMALLFAALRGGLVVMNTVTCKNNLKQIGSAFVQYTTEHGYYPMAGQDMWPPTYNSAGVPYAGKQQTGGWAFQILPYLGKKDVWQGAGGTTNQQKMLNAMATPHKEYFCPVRPRPNQQTLYTSPPAPQAYIDNVNAASGGGNYTSFPVAQIDYAASAPSYLTRDPKMAFTGLIRPNGMNAQLKGRDVEDTSNTLMVGEKRLNTVNLGGVAKKDDNQGYCVGYDEDNVRNTTDQGRTDPNPAVFMAWEPRLDYRGSGDYDAQGNLRFGSSHATAFHAAFADGTVKQIQYSIDPKIFEQLGRVNNKGSIPDW